MKLDEHNKKLVEETISTICKTAIVVWNTLAEEGQDLIKRFDSVVECMVHTYELGETALKEYRGEIEAAKEMEAEIKQTVSSVEAETAQETIFKLCDNLKNPKQIMEYVHTACEIVNVWKP